ncbi:MAG: hypothetical protein P4M12_12955 [Gammaproteobacteria bacterium]|nr:hypothetical protein [Gammaproteobacteria bacterium]
MFNSIKKISGRISLIITLAIASSSVLAANAIPAPTAAETTTSTGSTSTTSTGDYLQQIADYTNGTLTAVNTLPGYLDEVLKLVVAWMTPDKTPTTANLQASFTTYANQFLAETTPDAALQQKMLTDFFGANGTPKILPYANDLSYQTLLGIPFFNPDPRETDSNKVDSPFNYIENAAGVHISHTIPGADWRGRANDQIAYANYYSTISAVQTYNAYILSKMYADMKNSKSLTAAESSLIQQASSSDWFSQVATEEIGIVLRQILMYNSQMFIIMTQQLDAQKQLLTAQAMNNTLLILSNQTGESFLINKAIQPPPGLR